MKHIAIFNNSGDVQTALNEETLLNPYVAKVSGALDYNSLQPAPSCFLGEWSDNGEGHYTFQILDTSETSWRTQKQIASIPNAYFDGKPATVTVSLQRLGSDWTIEMTCEGASEPDTYAFQLLPETWLPSHTVMDLNVSEALVGVYWGGFAAAYLDIYCAFLGSSFNLDTINPVCD